MNEFKITQGEAEVKTYINEASGLQRKFCGNCGSPILSHRPTSGITALRLGSLDTPLENGPGAHIFVDSKAHWDQITDDLPCYAERPEI